MTPHGRAHVDAAKADGRWEAAYEGQRAMTPPTDLVRAIRANPRAHATFTTLDRTNLYALSFRVGALKTPEGRAKRIAAFVEMLARGKAPYPIKVEKKISKPKRPKRT